MKTKPQTETEAELVLKVAQPYQKNLETEKKRRKRFFDSTASDWHNLINSYSEILEKKKFEGLSNFLYLDSQGLVTIGTGHLVGYNSEDFKANCETIKNRLQKELKKKELRATLNKISSPYVIFDYLTITTEELVDLFKRSKYLKLGVLEVLSLPFGISNDSEKNINRSCLVVPETSIKNVTSPEKERKELFINSFLSLTKLSIMLHARQQIFSRKGPNPFFSTGFYSLKYNALALKEDTLSLLNQEDIAVKVGELSSYLKNNKTKLSDFSFPAQLGLLDLMYTGSVPLFKEAILAKDYSELKKAALSKRPKTQTERNQWVSSQFAEAEKLSKKAKAQ